MVLPLLFLLSILFMQDLQEGMEQAAEVIVG